MQDTPTDCRPVLHELIAMGMDLARAIHAQAVHAQAAAPAESPPDPTIPFDRIARCIRRSVALARHLDEPLPVQAAQPAPDRAAARRRILRAVEDEIHRHVPVTKGDALHAELLERLDGPDLDDELDHQPVADVIVDICRDLGIATLPGTRYWKRRTPADIADLNARAARPPATERRGPSLRLVPRSGDPGGS